MNLAVFISGTGSNLRAIVSAIENGALNARPVVVVSSNPEAKGLEFASAKNIPTTVLERRKFGSGGEFADALLKVLRQHQADFLALAGYMKMLPPRVVAQFRGRAVNIHPALLPKFGGKGMFGIHVHEAVLAAREIETGVTVHYVDEIYDHGAIIAQRRVPVLPDDTPETLQQRVLEQEHLIYPEVLQYLSSHET